MIQRGKRKKKSAVNMEEEGGRRERNKIAEEERASGEREMIERERRNGGEGEEGSLKPSAAAADGVRLLSLLLMFCSSRIAEDGLMHGLLKLLMQQLLLLFC